MKEITLRVTDEEYVALGEFRHYREREFEVYEGTEAGEYVLATDEGGSFVFAECPNFPEGATLIAAAFNGLFRGREA